MKNFAGKMGSKLGRFSFPFIFYPKLMKNVYLFSFQHHQKQFFHQSQEHYHYYIQYKLQRDVKIYSGMSPVICDMLYFRSLVLFKTYVDLMHMIKRWERFYSEKK